MSGHTPGPWEAKRSAGADHWVVYGGGEPLADVVTWSEEVDEADAHLIAAAPDLLAAAKEARTLIDTLVDNGRLGLHSQAEAWAVDTSRQITAAIVRATSPAIEPRGMGQNRG